MGWEQIMQMIAGLGSAGVGLWQGLGHGYNDPTKGASNIIGGVPGKTEPYYSPYMNAGKGALEDLQNQNKGLLSGDVQNQLGANYKESPGYQYKLKQALQLQGNAAARGGYLGTPMDQQNAAEIGNGLASSDYNDYIKNQMGLYGLGYQGEQGLNNQGFEANKGMADTWANTLNQQGALNYAGIAGKNTYQNSGWEQMMKGLGFAFGGGGKGV